MWLKLFKLWKVPAMVGSVVLVNALTHCALLHSVCDLKAAQMKVLSCLIQDFMLYEFRLDYKTAEATKNICCVKSDGTVDHSMVTRLFKNFLLGCKNFDNQARSGRPKSVDCEAILQAIETNLVNSSTQRISGIGLASLHPVWFITFTTLAKASRTTELCLTLLKYCQTFDSP